MDLEKHRIENVPATAFYIPDFVSAEREKLLLSQICRTPKVRWTQLTHRRLMNLGGVPHPKVEMGLHS